MDPGLVDHPADHGKAGGLHRVRITAHQRMPFGQRPAVGAQAVGTGVGQLVENFGIVRADHQAAGHLADAVGIVATAALLRVELAAGHVGEEQLAGFLVLELEQAAATAAVTQGLPLVGRELMEGDVLPEARPH